MAQWVKRVRADGGESIQIKWRMEGRWQSETFIDARLAAEFRMAVEMADHRWPGGWLKGHGWAPHGNDLGSESPPVPSRDVNPQTMSSGYTPELKVAEPRLKDVALGPGGYFEAQERRARRGKIKPYTVHRERRAFALHLEETFGDQEFIQLNSGLISDWVDEQLESGAAAKSIRHRHGLLSSIAKHGQQRMRLRSDNPCEPTELPELTAGTSQARQVRFLQHGEWALFRSCLKSDVRLLHDVELSTGVRWGEISAFRVGDISFIGQDEDLKANIHIVRAWSKRAPDDSSSIRWEEGENLSWVLGPPKSGRARWVAAVGQVAQDLQAAVSGRGRDEYVFSTRRGNPWRYPDYYSDRWAPARRLAASHGLTRAVTPHMLRHTCVVWSLADGVPIQVVSEMIGHTSLQMTYDVYGGLVNLHDPIMAQAMARALLASSAALKPVIPALETARPIRPGPRGGSRRRAS